MGVAGARGRVTCEHMKNKALCVFECVYKAVKSTVSIKWGRGWVRQMG
jgi:hypothetical protein